MNAALHSHLELRGRFLWLARAAWSILFLASAYLLIVGTVTKYKVPLPENCGVIACNPIEFTENDAAVLRSRGSNSDVIRFAGISMNLVMNLGFFILGLFLTWRKSNDWLVLLMTATLFVLGGVAFSPANDVLIRTRPDLVPVINFLQVPAYHALIFLLFIFPDGRFVPRWFGWFLIPIFVFSLDPWFADSQVESNRNIYVLFYLIIGILTFAAQIYRYKYVSNSVERQQSKWGLLGLVGIFMVMFGWAIMASFYPPDQPSIARPYVLLGVWFAGMLIGLLVPYSFTVAVLRYRLWDIDVIFRRTLSYALLSALLAFVFFTWVVTLQNVFRILIGQVDTPLVTVISTLTIAAIFNPLRSRMQIIIDKRFFRKKYDAQKSLQHFSQTARDEVDIDKLSEAMLSVLNETMQPEYSAFWIVDSREKAAS